MRGCLFFPINMLNQQGKIKDCRFLFFLENSRHGQDILIKLPQKDWIKIILVHVLKFNSGRNKCTVATTMVPISQIDAS